MRYFIFTFGCQMQKSDSERIASFLESLGYKKEERVEKSDLVIVNMCSVRQSAVDRVFGLCKRLRDLKQKNQRIKLILTGCILRKDRERFKKFFDFILNIRDLPNWGKIIFSSEKFYQDFDFLEKKCEYFKILPKPITKFRALLPISTGCKNFCSYCVVPFVRGTLICRDHREILKEAENFVKEGFKEIWLLGQNVNDYQSPSDPKVDFAKLLEMINQIKGNFWIRFTSPHPANFSQKLIDKMARCQKFTPYLNLPLQSGDNEILKKMKRNYTVSQYKKVVRKIRKAFKKYRRGLEKEIAISTDIIVGFPGEKKHHFENTKKIMKEIKFFMAYIARYSPRPETSAFNLKDDVSLEEKEKREKELTQIFKKTALKFNLKFLRKEVKVLVEEKKENYYLGKTRHYQTIRLPSFEDILGRFIKARVVKVTPFGLEGEITSLNG